MTRRGKRDAAAPLVCVHCGGDCAAHLATFVRRLVARIEPWREPARARLCVPPSSRGSR